jgi:hypothetical protein
VVSSEAGLRLAHGQQAFGLEPAERAEAPSVAQGPGDLGVDVVGEGVARVAEVAVAVGIECLEALAGRCPRRRRTPTATGPPSMPMCWADTPTQA